MLLSMPISHVENNIDKEFSNLVSLLAKNLNETLKESEKLFEIFIGSEMKQTKLQSCTQIDILWYFLLGIFATNTRKYSSMIEREKNILGSVESTSLSFKSCFITQRWYRRNTRKRFDFYLIQ